MSKRHTKIWKQLQTLFDYSQVLEAGGRDEELGISERSRRDHLRDLRLALGGKDLLDSHHHLTDLGSKCVELAAELRRRLDDALLAFNRDPVRVAMTSHISRNYLQGMLQEFWGSEASKRPVVAVDRRADEVIRHVRDLKVDLGIGPLTQDEACANQLEALRYFKSEAVIIAAKRRGPPEPLTWPWLLDQPWLLHEEHTATRSLFDRAHRVYREGNPDARPISVVLETTDVKLLLDYVIADLGISFVANAPVIEEARKQGTIVTAKLPTLGASFEGSDGCLSVAIFWSQREGRERLPQVVQELAKIAERQLADFLDRGELLVG